MFLQRYRSVGIPQHGLCSGLMLPCCIWYEQVCLILATIVVSNVVYVCAVDLCSLFKKLGAFLSVNLTSDCVEIVMKKLHGFQGVGCVCLLYVV